jgi:hypothetical protein
MDEVLDESRKVDVHILPSLNFGHAEFKPPLFAAVRGSSSLVS